MTNIIKEVETMHEEEIEVKLQKLPEDIRREVLNYMEFLLKKYKGTERRQRNLGSTGKRDCQR